MEITTKVNSNIMYVSLNGELDEYTSIFARKSLDDAFNNNIFNDVVFDMTHLDFMDSTGIGMLLGRYKHLKAKNKDIFIKNANPTIDKIIRMSGIYEIMPKIS